MSIGIYKIENLVNHKVYIGQSINIERRKYSHKNDLKRNCQHNKLMQQDFNLYGIENFSFEILELCAKNKLNEREQFYIQKYQSDIQGYNYTIGGKYTKETKLMEKSLRLSSYNLHQAHLIKYALYMDMDREEISKMFHISINVLYNIHHYVWFYKINLKMNYYIIHRNEILLSIRNHKMRKMFACGYAVYDILKKYHVTMMPKIYEIDKRNRDNKLKFQTKLIKNYSLFLKKRYTLKHISKILKINYKTLLKILNHNFVLTPKYVNCDIKNIIHGSDKHEYWNL